MKFEEELSRRLGEWEKAGCLSAGGRDRILEIERLRAREAGSSSFGRILGILGAILLGFSLLSFVAAHWEGMAAWGRSGLSFAVFAAALAAGFRFRSAGREHAAEAAFLASALCFAANVGLQAQIFHIPSSGNAGILLSWAGIAAVAWGGNSRSAGLAAALAAGLWGALEFFGEGRLMGIFWRGFGSAGDLVSWKFLAMWAVSAWPLFAGPGWVGAKVLAADLFALGLGVALFEALAWTGLGSSGLEAGSELLLGFALMNLCLLMGFLGLAARWAEARHFAFASGKLLALALFACTFQLWPAEFSGPWKDPGSWLWVGRAGFAALAAGLALRGAGSCDPRDWPWRGCVLAWAVLLGGLPPWVVGTGVFYWAANALFGATLVVAFRYAVDLRSERSVNALFGGFFAWVVSRYFDLAGTFMGSSLFFLVGGIGLIALAKFMNDRRRALFKEMG